MTWCVRMSAARSAAPSVVVSRSRSCAPVISAHTSMNRGVTVAIS
jgi:hypothetical protein